MARRARFGTLDLLLEAEVAPRSQTRFENRYNAATGATISPGTPVHYQSQGNKWGSELRGYFNDPALAAVLSALGIHVEFPRRGYMAGRYAYRFNNNNLWWTLVEDGGLRLGPN